MTASASERWARHYMTCEGCHVDESEAWRDSFCDIGFLLREKSVEEAFKTMRSLKPSEIDRRMAAS